ncbi:hypothetical protein [Lentzea sp. NPDC003310]|uniref:hypothetical protein n=1 Tax=Lentzea sp. NPDC003310 TaxID=3154447 RepID=UPI0033B2323A
MRTTAVLLVTAGLTSASALPAAPVALAESDQGELLAIAQRYLHNRAQKVVNGPQTPGFGVPVTPELAAKLAVHEAKIAAARAKAVVLYRAAAVTVRAEWFEVGRTGRTVVASVHEGAEMHYSVPGTAPTTSYGLPHLLTFTRSGDGWVLADVALGYYKHCALLPETQQPSEC